MAQGRVLTPKPGPGLKHPFRSTMLRSRRSLKVGDFVISRQDGLTYVNFVMHDPETGMGGELIGRSLARVVAEARLVLKDLGVAI